MSRSQHSLSTVRSLDRAVISMILPLMAASVLNAPLVWAGWVPLSWTEYGLLALSTVGLLGIVRRVRGRCAVPAGALPGSGDGGAVDELGHHSAQIGALLGKIQAATAACVAGMAEASQQAVLGSALSGEAGEALASIEQAVDLTVAQVREIHSRIQAVVKTSARMETAIHQMAAVSEENTAAAEEMAAASGQVASSIHSVEQVARQGLGAVGQVRTDLGRLTAVVGDTARASRDLSALAGALEATVHAG